MLTFEFTEWRDQVVVTVDSKKNPCSNALYMIRYERKETLWMDLPSKTKYLERSSLPLTLDPLTAYSVYKFDITFWCSANSVVYQTSRTPMLKSSE